MRHILNGSIIPMQCACQKCRSARDHTNEEKVDRLQNKEKNIDEIANKEEELKKLEDKERESLMAMSAEERDNLIQELKDELAALRKGTKKASTLETIGVNNDNIKHTKYHVMKLENISTTESRDGDKLLIQLGSSY